MTAEIPAVDPGQEQTRSVSTTSRLLLLLVSAGGAISNLGIILVASRSLDVHQNKEFLVFWALLFGLFGVQSGIQNETTRATSAPARSGARVINAGALWGVSFAVLIGLSTPLWGPALLPHSTAAAALSLGVAALLYPVYVSILGALGGTRHWEWFSSSLLIEVGLRVVLVLGAAALGASLGGFEAASAAAVLTLFVVLVIGRVPRRATAERADVPFGRLLRQQGIAMTSTACTAVLVNAYPALVALTTPEDSLGLPPAEAAALMGGCILAVTLTRAPIMMPLTVFVGVAISAFTGHSGSVWAAIRKPFGLLLAVGALGALAAWPIGPWALRIFKPEYDLPGWYFAALTLSSVAMAWLTILGALALATRHHGLYALGWGAASATGALCLLLPLPLTATTLLSVSVGPMVGVLIVFLRLQLAHARTAAHDSGAASA